MELSAAEEVVDATVQVYGTLPARRHQDTVREIWRQVLRPESEVQQIRIRRHRPRPRGILLYGLEDLRGHDVARREGRLHGARHPRGAQPPEARREGCNPVPAPLLAAGKQLRQYPLLVRAQPLRLEHGLRLWFLSYLRGEVLLSIEAARHRRLVAVAVCPAAQQGNPEGKD